jgi:Multiubiquitin
MGEPGKNPGGKDYEIAVNGTPAPVTDARVSYEEVVKIAFPVPEPNVSYYSVTYHNADGPHGGTGMLVAGESVTVKREGTSFDVVATIRS